MKKQSFCIWCGKSHPDKLFFTIKDPRPTKCKAADNKASRILRSGVPAWVLMRILEVKGTDALFNFEEAALEVFPRAIEFELKKIRIDKNGN